MSDTYSSMPTNASPLLDDAQYQAMYQHSLEDPQEFWEEMAKKRISWFSPWTTTFDGDFRQGKFKWFDGGKLNVCYNCVDRHLAENGTGIALIWEGENPNDFQKFTYNDVYAEVCRFANILKRYRVRKGDRICIYLPMVPDAIFAMLACARIGAVHTVVFSGFSAQALRDRILDAECRILITADATHRDGKIIHLKQNADIALEECPCIEKVLVVGKTKETIGWRLDRDLNYNEIKNTVEQDCPCTEMDAEDPLFILYTSGSTGKPKGVLHTTGGYITYAATTFRYVFNFHAGDVHWCTADVGWITGHSYITYGPLANGATILIYEGSPTYPDASRVWQMIDRHRVNIFYTAPTMIRMLMKQGDHYVKQTHRRSLKILGSVGEPINPAAWQWYYEKVGDKYCPIVDTWWQTETGGIMLTPIPGCGHLKPGAATRPFFGVEPALLDDKGVLIRGEGTGHLVLRRAWPGMLRTLYGDHRRFMENYLKKFPGCYYTGDQATRDADGDYWIGGRADDVINVSGHRLCTAEIESALVSHQAIAEAAVVGCPHPIKGQGVYAFVIPMNEQAFNDEMQTELNQCLREKIGPIAKLDALQCSTELPKTRSGKIMRRILRKIANNNFSDLGDTSTLADDTILQSLIDNRIVIDTNLAIDDE